MKVRLYAALLAALTFLTTLSYGQAVNGTILGTITDITGATVAGAKVTAQETNTGTTRNTVTNDTGNFEFPNLPPGTYTITVEQNGFKKVSRGNVEPTRRLLPRRVTELQQFGQFVIDDHAFARCMPINAGDLALHVAAR